MSEDHLSNEIAVSAEITPTGVNAKAKSRMLSAFDRLVGSAIDRWTPKLEGPAALARAQNAREVRINEALTDQMVAMIHAEPLIAERALEQHLGTIGRRQENKEAVVTLALEDLSQAPPSEDQNTAGPDVLDEDFLGRFERYAEDATSDRLRERWGRVLASEVRKPGTFSAKVMRTVDEMDSSTAALFEKICEARIGDCIPKAILTKVDYVDQTRLVSTGLIVEPGLGQIRLGSVINDSSGQQLKMIPLGETAIAVVSGEDFVYPSTGNDVPVQDHEGRPAVPIWLLTDVGHAISSILPSHEPAAFNKLLDSVADYLKPSEVRVYHKQPDSDQWTMIRTISRPVEDAALTI